MIDAVLEIFHDYTFQVVALGSAMLGVISGNGSDRKSVV